MDIFDVTVPVPPVSEDRWPPRIVRGLIAYGTDPERKVPRAFGLDIVEVPTHGTIHDDYFVMAKDRYGNVSYSVGVHYERSQCEINGHKVPGATFTMMSSFHPDEYPGVTFSGGACRVCGERIPGYPR